MLSKTILHTDLSKPLYLNWKKESKQKKIVLSHICEMQKLSIIAMNLTLIKMIFKKLQNFEDFFLDKNKINQKEKISFSITDNQIIANEFNNFVVSIGKKTS